MGDDIPIHGAIGRIVGAFHVEVRPVPVNIRRAVRRLLDASPHLREADNRDLLRSSLLGVLAQSASESTRAGLIFDREFDEPEVEPTPAPRSAPSKTVAWLISLVLTASVVSVLLVVGTPVSTVAPPVGVGVNPRPPAAPHEPGGRRVELAPDASATGPRRVPYVTEPSGIEPDWVFRSIIAVLLLTFGLRLLLSIAGRNRHARHARHHLLRQAEKSKQQAAAAELDAQPPKRQPDIWAEPPHGAHAASQILRRSLETEPGRRLDPNATARATARAAGRFDPVFESRRPRTRLTILLDDEGDEHVWSGGLRALVRCWCEAGIDVAMWRFDTVPWALWSSDDGRGVQLDRLARQCADEPLLILSRSLGTVHGGAWSRCLTTWSTVVWIDPDPRHAHRRRATERAAIHSLTRRGVLRLPMTPDGLCAAAEAIATGQARSVLSSTWPGLPDTDQPEVQRALARWRLAVSQKPDATWELVEHLRRRVSGVATVFGHRRDVQVLIDAVHRAGAQRPDRPGQRPGSGAILFIEHAAAVDWMYQILGQGAEGAELNREVARLLIDWEASHPPSTPYERAISDLKVTWHRIKLEPTRRRIEQLVERAGAAVHDYVEDYLAALTGAVERGLLPLDGAARRALANAQAVVFGHSNRLPLATALGGRRPWLGISATIALAAAAIFGVLVIGHQENDASVRTVGWGPKAAMATTSGGVDDYLRITEPESADAGAPSDAVPFDSDSTSVDGSIATGDGRGNGADVRGPQAGDAGASEASDTIVAPDAGVRPIDMGVFDARPPLDVGPTSPPRPRLTDEECRRRSQCRQYGQCVAAEDRCVAGRPDDCELSSNCRSDGQCTLIGRFCKVDTDADCLGSRACQNAGLCSARSSRCTATSADACARSRSCVRDGLCGLRGDTCRAVTAAHCAASTSCRDEGLCSPTADGFCSAGSVDDCRRLCQSEGRCSVVDGECVATSVEECRRSIGCVNDARCTPTDGKCVVGPGDCAISKRCGVEGRCDQSDSECVARTRQGCVESLNGRIYGLNTPVDDACVALNDQDCTTAKVCTQDGRCTARAGRCVAGGEDCRRFCKTTGRCAPRDGVCRATDVAHCRESSGCAKQGLCSYEHQDGSCIARRDADCMDSAVCREEGRCWVSGSTCATRRGR